MSAYEGVVVPEVDDALIIDTSIRRITAYKEEKNNGETSNEVTVTEHQLQLIINTAPSFHLI